MSHLQQGRSLMAPYLPQIGSGSGDSASSEGGALYALGLIHANNGEGIKQFLRDSLRSTNVEVVHHGACLGLGLAALGTADEDIYDEIKSVLYTDSVVAGEASGISMGLLMVGTANEKASEMDLALGIALTVYGREEEADTLIEQMTRDQDLILRYGGMYAFALANAGTTNNKAIRQNFIHVNHFKTRYQFIDDGKLKDLTVMELKTCLTAKKLAIGGKKEVLINDAKANEMIICLEDRLRAKGILSSDKDLM
ncbi:26S proteasome non-ATPase regulatory subunit 1-like protein [Tanacetum coccineum]